MNIKTPVSWMGNKTFVLHILYVLFPLNYERYIEPFGGPGAMLLGKKKPDKFEVYNDYSHNLVNLTFQGSMYISADSLGMTI